jgi:hypothetical protein
VSVSCFSSNMCGGSFSLHATLSKDCANQAWLCRVPACFASPLGAVITCVQQHFAFETCNTPARPKVPC